MEEVFANQLVSMVKALPFGDIFQEAQSAQCQGLSCTRRAARKPSRCRATELLVPSLYSFHRLP